MARGIVSISYSTVAKAADAVKRGGLVVFPTDTVYGLGCDPFSERAVARLFEAKGRTSKPIPVLCDSILSARRLVELNATALSLARRYWPGALTIVSRAKRGLPFLVNQGSGELGVRVPALKSCLELIAVCGGYLAGTSANVSGRPACRTASEALSALGDKVDFVLDGGYCAGSESTVARVRGDLVEVLRRGSVEVHEMSGTSSQRRA